MTQKQLKELVKSGAAVNITTAESREAIPENYDILARSYGNYGANGMLIKGRDTGRLYAIVARSTAIFIF
jgi:hypothetical protein